MFDNGLFGGLFDFDGDGKLDSFEKAAEFATFMELISESEKTTQNTADDSSDIFDTTELEDTLVDAGIDMLDFELMDDDERAEALADAGYDIDDFDF